MKIQYLILLLLFSTTTFLSAQIWTAEVPYKTTSEVDGVIRDLIKTNDNGFLVLLTTQDSTSIFNKFQHTMLKYNSIGELEWDKSYDFGANIPNPFTNSGGAFPNKAIQLNNDNYLIRGGTRKDTIDNSYIFIASSVGDSLSFQTTENYHNVQLANDRIWGLRSEDLQQSFLNELDDMGNLVSETPLENATSLNLLVTPDESVFHKTGLFFRKYNLNGEIITEQDADFSPKFFTTNELLGMVAFGEKLTKFDNDLNIIWDLNYEELFPWADNSLSPDYKGLFRTTSDDYIFYGSVYDDFFLDFRFPYIYKYSKDGEYIWGGTYSMNTLPYTYVAGVVEVEDGIVTLGGNVFNNKIQMVKLYPNGLGQPTSTEDITLSKTDFHIFPNPVSNLLTIKFPEATTGQVQLINAQGQIMTTENISFVQMYQINLQSYPTGFYVVKVMTKQGIINSRTIIKQ